MTDKCPSCEYNKQRAALWREEAYRNAGHQLSEQTPVSWRIHDGKMWCYFNHIVAMLPPPFEPLYAVPQRSTWQELTDQEINFLWKESPHIVGLYTYTDIVRQVEAKLRELNT